MTPDDLDELKAPFDDAQVCVKVQAISKDGTRAMLVQYLQHTDVATRLDQVDASWASKIHKIEPMGETFYVHMELTILGVSRDNIGEGQDPKSAASDALKRCAMLFGVGRYLYDEGRVWVPYNESEDRYREWTIADYTGYSRPDPQAPRPRSSRKAPVEPVGNSRPQRRSKVELVGEVRELQDLLKLSERDLISWARECGGVSPDKMDVSQLEKFVGQLQTEARKAGHRV